LNNLQTIRKKILGNDHINIIWVDNPHQEFDNGIIMSGAILIYIIVYPISNTHYLIKLRQNKRSRFNIIDKISVYFNDEIIINIDNYSISSYLIYLIISFNLIINYTLQKNTFKKIEGVSIGLDTNITQRYKEIERIIYRFKTI
jgi:hypothetical protein